jgi:exonuclease VII small subunit
MAEKLNYTPEQHNENQESSQFEHHEVHKKSPEVNQETAEEKSKRLEEITRKIEKEAKTSEQLRPKSESDIKKSHTHQNGPYHEYSGAQAIKRVQKHLKPAERRFSKVIHTPGVEIASDIVGGSVARPSGLLYGGIFSLLSSLGFYLFARHYGYEYSYFIGILFFVGGFVFGLLTELVLRIIRKNT